MSANVDQKTSPSVTQTNSGLKTATYGSPKWASKRKTTKEEY